MYFLRVFPPRACASSLFIAEKKNATILHYGPTGLKPQVLRAIAINLEAFFYWKKDRNISLRRVIRNLKHREVSLL